MSQLDQLLGKTLILTAHPDDESVGCGGLMQRMKSPLLVFATDGAPRDDYFWHKHGSREAYARLREDEARRAAAIIGNVEVDFLGARAGIVDQELFRSLPKAIIELRAVIDRVQPTALLVLAYEGGHPDHDSCNFIASVIATERGIPAWEFPLYHRSVDGLGVTQDFILPNGTEITFEPTAAEIERKHRAILAYASQGDLLSSFNSLTERFRPLAPYDYTLPPHSGVLNYEAWQWPITGAQVAAAFAEYLQVGEPKTRL